MKNQEPSLNLIIWLFYLFCSVSNFHSQTEDCAINPPPSPKSTSILSKSTTHIMEVQSLIWCQTDRIFICVLLLVHYSHFLTMGTSIGQKTIKLNAEQSSTISLTKTPLLTYQLLSKCLHRHLRKDSQSIIPQLDRYRGL